MSILFRTQERLTIFDLTHAWGSELAEDGESEQHVQDLARILLQDIVNGCLDESGPLRNGRRLGVGVITADYKIGFIEGHYFLDLVKSELMRDWCLHYIVVMKEAALDFARRREIPPPSWWSDHISISTDAKIRNSPPLIADAPVPTSTYSARPRGRKPNKFGRTKGAMHEDIRLGRLTANGLREMPEKTLAGRYAVSRDTARKVRNAVLSEIPPTTHLPSSAASE